MFSSVLNSEVDKNFFETESQKKYLPLPKIIFETESQEKYLPLPKISFS